MKREELLKSKDYVKSGMQLKLLNLIEDYMKRNGLKRNELAKELNVTKGYISQLLNVSYDHKLSKVVELALSCNSMPLLFFVDLDRYIKEDSKDRIFELMPMQRQMLVNTQQAVSSLSYSDKNKGSFLTQLKNSLDTKSHVETVQSNTPVININSHQIAAKLIS